MVFPYYHEMLLKSKTYFEEKMSQKIYTQLIRFLSTFAEEVRNDESPIWSPDFNALHNISASLSPSHQFSVNSEREYCNENVIESIRVVKDYGKMLGPICKSAYQFL
ncbi:histone acetyltransferase KAT2A [Caerostris extrusa]|uniref:Histone acetyltransferase KAT2A n=1 Tax=Caerostris extrusa TaxID=172846 RepID=A0AAV4PJ35_CAEEX|nr:histone acetyltransferase KAT2A [Caerostris extrusa]